MTEPRPEWPGNQAAAEPPIRAQLDVTTARGSHVAIEIKSANLAVVLTALGRAETYLLGEGGKHERRISDEGRQVGPDARSQQGDGQEPEPAGQP